MRKWEKNFDDEVEWFLDGGDGFEIWKIVVWDMRKWEKILKMMKMMKFADEDDEVRAKMGFHVQIVMIHNIWLLLNGEGKNDILMYK